MIRPAGRARIARDMRENPLPGMAVLIREHADWLDGLRLGLVSHAAAVGPDGTPSAELLAGQAHGMLLCLFAPEHGFNGKAAAGEKIGDRRHPSLDLPIHSLYGDTRRPTAEMLQEVDAIVFDLQDLGVRCFTYVSTLRYVMQAAAEHRKALIVCDRPIPLPAAVDGPMLDPAFESFVGCIPTPLAYGMTPGETARLLQRSLGLDLDLRVAEMQGWDRASAWPAGWPWIPPSPGIRTWDTAMAYPATVWCEAMPAVDCGRGTDMIFRVLGMPGMKGHEVCDALAAAGLPGVSFHPHTYRAAAGIHQGHTLHGLRLEVTDPAAFQPVHTAVTILSVLHKTSGPDALWSARGTRPEFLDQLMGTDAIRRALQAGRSASDIAAGWAAVLAMFRERRAGCLLYQH